MVRSPREIVLCGACMSGNIGGPALYISFAEELQRHLPDARFTVLSKYPGGDAAMCGERGWDMKDMRTVRQLFPGVLIGLVGWLLRLARLPYRWVFRGDFAPYATGDVLVDMSGISFTDHRPGMGLLINCLWFVPALGAGIPIVKASQAMGPFKTGYIRLVSRFFLSRMRLLIARGAASEGYVKELLPGRDVRQLPDSAFALDPADRAGVKALLEQAGLPGNARYCILGPSHIVDRYASSPGSGLYVDSLVSVARQILDKTDMHIVLLSHELKNDAEDDYAVCKAVAAALGDPARCHLVPPGSDPKLAKGVCAGAEIAIGSRFHFLVATLSSGVPSLAIAWSHKYFEMMQMVGQEDMVISHEQLSRDGLAGAARRLWEERDVRRKAIGERLPEVVGKARMNGVWVAQMLQAGPDGEAEG